VVCIFARQTSEPLTSLVKKIDEQIAQNPELKSFVVVLTDDADRTAEELEAMAKDGGIKHAPLTVVESPSGPPAYKIAEDADVTVMMWKNGEVRSSRGFKGALTDQDIAAIVADAAELP
jgi:hypothetical protein